MFLNLLTSALPFTSTTVKAFYSSSILLPLAHLPLILLHFGSPFLLFSSDNMVKRIRERAQPLDGNGMSVFPEEEGEEEGRERCEHAESAASCANIPTLHRSQNSRTKHAAVVVFSCRLSVSHNFLHLFSIHSLTESFRCVGRFAFWQCRWDTIIINARPPGPNPAYA